MEHDRQVTYEMTARTPYLPFAAASKILTVRLDFIDEFIFGFGCAERIVLNLWSELCDYVSIPATAKTTDWIVQEIRIQISLIVHPQGQY